MTMMISRVGCVGLTELEAVNESIDGRRRPSCSRALAARGDNLVSVTLDRFFFGELTTSGRASVCSGS